MGERGINSASSFTHHGTPLANQLDYLSLIAPDSQLSATITSGFSLPFSTLKPEVLLRAEKRIRNRQSCGKHGFVAVYREKSSGKHLYRFLPIRCKSVLCPYCAWIDSKKRLKALRNLLFAINEPIAFLTLTFPNFDNPIDAVSYALQVKRKFYNFKVFGRRKWSKVKEKALELLETYLQNIEDEREREKKRRFHLWTIQRFERAWSDELYNSKGKFYMGRILRSVWKFEITYNPNTGWHPHFHVLVVGLFPLFLVQAVWVMCGGGEIIDLRLARSVEEVAEYVADYESKPVIDLEEGQDLPYELQLALEASLYRRKLFEVWGLSLRQEEEDDFEFVAVVRGVRCELKLENLHELPLLVKRLRKYSRDGPAVMFLCWATVRLRDVVGDVVIDWKEKAGVYLDEEGRIWLVGDEKFESLMSL